MYWNKIVFSKNKLIKRQDFIKGLQQIRYSPSYVCVYVCMCVDLKR